MGRTCPPTESRVSSLEDETVKRAPPLGPDGVRAWLIFDSTGQAESVEVDNEYIMGRTGLTARDLVLFDTPSTIVGQDKAIVINLEFIQAVITAQEVLLLNSDDPSLMPFVKKMKHRLFRLHQAPKSQVGRFSGDVKVRADSDDTERDKVDGLENRPFEFVALEVCLKSACSYLHNEAEALESEAYKWTTNPNLEHFQQIKRQIVQIMGRVIKIRDELHHLLHDDVDLAEMYLTEKILQQRTEDNRMSRNLDIDELQGILVEFLVQIRWILKNLSRTRKYVDNTEDHIKIGLEEKQMHFSRMKFVMCATNFLMSAIAAVITIIRMTFEIELFTHKSGNYFWWVVGGAIFLLMAWSKYKQFLDRVPRSHRVAYGIQQHCL